MTPAPMNLLDRLIAYVAPGVAIKRAAARGVIEAFSGPSGDGAPTSPSNGRWRARPRSANADTLRALPRQRGESRELIAYNPIAAGAVSTNVNRVVGTGLVPVPDPVIEVLGWTQDQADEFSAAWFREFSMWADSTDCCIEGNQTFYERQGLVLSSRLGSGDCFTLMPDGDATGTMPYRLRLQLLEADRCGNPLGQLDTAEIVGGVRITPNGAPQSYFIYDQHPGALQQTLTAGQYRGQWYDRIGESGRRRILHHYRPTRPEQARGVPYLAPVIQAIKDLGRYTEAEITAAVVSAFYTVFIEKTDSNASPAPIFRGDESAAPDPGLAEDEVALGAGAVVGLGKNEKVSIADPNRPNTAYEPFVTGVLTLIGAGLGLPVELLVKKFNASYSASKAALLDAWQHFRTERAWMVNSFCQPVYETLMAEAVATGRIVVPGFFTNPLVRWAVTRASWHGDSQGSINPKDEVAAYRDAIDARLMTHTRAEWELFGSDWSRTYSTKVREVQRMRADGIEPAARAGAAPARPPADQAGASNQPTGGAA